MSTAVALDQVRTFDIAECKSLALQMKAAGIRAVALCPRPT